MSKKKRRYLKIKSKKTRRDYVACGKDTHHIFYQKRYWRGEALNMLRDYWYCKAEIPKNTLHRRIHSSIQDVPAPKAINAKNALDQLRLLERYEVIHENDTIERRLEVLIALFDYVEQPTAEALKRQLHVARKYYYKPP